MGLSDHILWTACWTGPDGEEYWDKMTQEDLVELLRELENRKAGLEVSLRDDVLVFPPGSEVDPYELI